jgi:hypothetical protein
MNYNRSSVTVRLDMLQSASYAAIIEFENDKKLISGKMDSSKTAFRQVKFSNTAKLSTLFALHIGRFLGYPTMPSSESWKHAGMSYNFRMFSTTLWDDMNLAPEDAILDMNPIPNESKEQEQSVDENAIDLEWKSQNKHAAFLRVCFYKLCAESKLNNTFSSYSDTILLNNLLEPAWDLYENNREYWDLPIISKNVLPKIRATAKTAWFKRILEITRYPGNSEMPGTDWKNDILNVRFREAWEKYYCNIIRHWKTTLPDTRGIKRAADESGSSASAGSRHSKLQKVRDSAESDITQEEIVAPVTAESKKTTEDDNAMIQTMLAQAASDRALLQNMATAMMDMCHNLKDMNNYLKENLEFQRQQAQHIIASSSPLTVTRERSRSSSQGMFSPVNSNDIVVFRNSHS